MTEQRPPYNEEKRITPDQIKFLKGLGLEIAPHSDPAYGWGYTWRDRSWEGPYPTQSDAVQAAFEDAIRAMHFRSEAPFPSHIGYAVRWDGQEWVPVKFEAGKFWHFTGAETDYGWEVLLPEEKEVRGEK